MERRFDRGPEGPEGPMKPGGVGPGRRVQELLELLLLGEVRRLLELSPRYRIRWTSEEVTYGMGVDGPLLELPLKFDDTRGLEIPVRPHPEEGR